MARKNIEVPHTKRTMGAAGGERALATGKELSGLALEAAQQVGQELVEGGASGMVKRDAIRFEAVASLYYQRILGCTDPAQLDALVQRWAWVQAHAVRTWQAVAAEEKNTRKGVSAADVLQTIQVVTDDDETKG